MRLISQHAWGGGRRMFLPGTLEFRSIAFRTVAVEEFQVRLNARYNEIFSRFVENRAPFLGVGL